MRSQPASAHSPVILPIQAERRARKQRAHDHSIARSGPGRAAGRAPQRRSPYGTTPLPPLAIRSLRRAPAGLPVVHCSAAQARGQYGHDVERHVERARDPPRCLGLHESRTPSDARPGRRSHRRPLLPGRPIGPASRRPWLCSRSSSRPGRQGGPVPKDITGHRVLTAEDLDRMTPEERQAAFDARVVTDLSELPAEYLAQLKARAAALAARREAAPASGRDVPPPRDLASPRCPPGTSMAPWSVSFRANEALEATVAVRLPVPRTCADLHQVRHRMGRPPRT